jgi:protein-disulfide isomerase
VTVTEYFSLTCPHCARFARDTLPQIVSQLVDTGKLRYVFVDYPLDQVALMAAQVAHALPPARYAPFADALLASQDRWAFAQNVNSTDELAKMAALAGLSRAQFDAAIADTGLRDAILARQDADTKTYQIDSTPTFIFNGPKAHNRKQAGEMSYDEFAKIVAEAGGATG